MPHREDTTTASADRAERVQVFHQRVAQAMERTGVTRAELARRVGVDRSTLSQLLAAGSDRLPRADTAAAIATALQISLDWLLGLSQDEKSSAEVLRHSLEIARSERSPVDASLMRWHREAVGYKIRHVPTNLPDVLKTNAVLTHEYAGSAWLTTEQARATREDRLAYVRLPDSDMEICHARQELEMLALGNGIWQDLPLEARREQLLHMIKLIEEFYPALRWFLYDGMAHFSAPLTVFGPQRAALYVGQVFLVFNTTQHIRMLARHFDDLIRAATIQANEIADYLRHLLSLTEDGALQG